MTCAWNCPAVACLLLLVLNAEVVNSTSLMVTNSSSAGFTTSATTQSTTPSMHVSSVFQNTQNFSTTIAATASMHVSSVFQNTQSFSTTIAATVNPTAALQTPPLTSTTWVGTSPPDVTPAPTSPSIKPVTSWADKIFAKIDPLLGVIILICAAGLIIILVIALGCVCHKYRKMKRLNSLKHLYIGGHDNTDWIRGNDNLMMWERNLRASEVTPHYPLDYASVNADRPPSYVSGYPAPDRRISGTR